MTEQIPLGWYYLPVAFLLGGLHALEPGHGKSLASAYLVSGKHSWKDAVVLGLATTFSHTAVVVLLALASFSLKGFFSSQELEQHVSTAGAALLIGLGLWVSIRSLRNIFHGHEHAHGHSHAHDASHARHGLWGVALLGLSNGALPCPGALAALLVALSLGKALMGFVTVSVYSLGLATALAAMGIIVVEAGRRARAWLPSDRLSLWLPLCSGLLVLGSGIFLLSR